MRLHIIAFVVLALAPAARAQVIDFEDLPPPAGGFYNGAAGAGGFTSRGAAFTDVYTPAFGTWAGWAYSRVADVTTPGFGNQYAAYNLPAGGGDASLTYGVAFQDFFTPVTPTITLPAGSRPVSVKITNATYDGPPLNNGEP